MQYFVLTVIQMDVISNFYYTIYDKNDNENDANEVSDVDDEPDNSH